MLEVPVAGVAERCWARPPIWMSRAEPRAEEPGRVSGAYLTIDAALAGETSARLKDMPTVAGRQRQIGGAGALPKMMDSGAGAIRYVMGAIAFVITFGIVYNAARIASPNGRATWPSLRVIGFTAGETAFVLLGELAVVTLAALPLGRSGGLLPVVRHRAGFSTELYQIPAVFDPASYGRAALRRARGGARLWLAGETGPRPVGPGRGAEDTGVDAWHGQESGPGWS